MYLRHSNLVYFLQASYSLLPSALCLLGTTSETGRRTYASEHVESSLTRMTGTEHAVTDLSA